MIYKGLPTVVATRASHQQVREPGTSRGNPETKDGNSQLGVTD